MPFSDKLTKSTDRHAATEVDGLFSALNGVNDLQSMIQMLQHQRPKVSHTPGISSLRESQTRDFKRLEKTYNDRLKLQREDIIRLQKEIQHMRDLVKKFLTPEQMKQL